MPGERIVKLYSSLLRLAIRPIPHQSSPAGYWNTFRDTAWVAATCWHQYAATKPAASVAQDPDGIMPGLAQNQATTR